MDRDTVAIGRLGAPKGVLGDLKVHSYSGESAHFRKLKIVELRAQAGLATAAKPGPESSVLKLRVLRIEGEGASLTMAFEGYATPEAARALTGMDIVVPLSAAAPLGPGEWYIDDLVGLCLLVEGAEVAKVKAVLDGGPDPWLEVQRNAAGVSLIPFRKEFVGRIDLEKGTIELLAPWLLE